MKKQDLIKNMYCRETNSSVKNGETVCSKLSTVESEKGINDIQRLFFEQYGYIKVYKPEVLNDNVDALSRMYTKNEIKENNFEPSMNDLRTKLIKNTNVKGTIGNLMRSSTDNSIVDETAMLYNF